MRPIRPIRLAIGLQRLAPFVLALCLASPAFADITYVRPIPGPVRHRVQSGESIWKIASRYDPIDIEGMAERIIQANSFLQYRDLREGDKLIIPVIDRINARK
jgi:hypothetical protein